jgi:uncharacterized protein YjbI with pentapeptide repeats
MPSHSPERFARLFAALDARDLATAAQQIAALRRDVPSDVRLGDAAARMAALTGDYAQIVPYLAAAAGVPAPRMDTPPVTGPITPVTTIVDPPDQYALRGIGPEMRGQSLVRNTAVTNSDWSGLHLAGLAFMNVRALRLVAGDVRLEDTWWENCEWNGVDFSRGAGEGMAWGGSRWAGVVANGARMARSRWHRQHFSSCQFMNADFGGTILSETRFDSCELLGARFGGAALLRVRFEHGVMNQAPLGQVDFRGAWLIDCDLTRADLYGADFTGAMLVHTAMPPGAAELAGATVIPRPLHRGPVDA